ncbi:MAG: YggT family protein [Alphaproteobacteria bacterium]|nr:YggT family protein [Alphaproteobacteria bacterium]
MDFSLIGLIGTAFELYIWIIITSVVLSWLVGFNVVNPYNPVVRAVQSFCYRATEPLLAPIRRFMPDLGGLDISPVVLLLGLQFVQILLVRTLTGQLLS